MASKFQSYAYNCRSLFNLKTSPAKIDRSAIDLRDAARPALGNLTRVDRFNSATSYTNDKLDSLYDDLTAACFQCGNDSEIRNFFIANFRPFGLFNELFRVMSNSATNKGYSIQNLDNVGNKNLKNTSDMHVQVVGSTIILTETVNIHKISNGHDTIESDTPLSVAKCRWVIEFGNGQPIVHLSDTTFTHNHVLAEKAFDHRGIVERLRHFLKRLFTRTDAGLKPLLDRNEKYRYSRVFRQPAASAEQSKLQSSEMSNS